MLINSHQVIAIECVSTKVILPTELNLFLHFHASWRYEDQKGKKKLEVKLRPKGKKPN